MAKNNKDYKYDITEIIGVATPNADLNSDWVKAVLKTLLNDTDEGIDVRKFNQKTNVLGNGIRLTIDEANNLADLLISHGYGSMEAIETEYKRRCDLFKENKND